MSLYSQTVGYPGRQMSFGGNQMGFGGQGQGQSEWVMVQYVTLPGELINRNPSQRPYYMHTASGYTQFEYPTTMTAMEMGLNGMGMGTGMGMGMGMGMGGGGGAGMGMGYNSGFGGGYRGSLPVQTPYSASAISRQEWPPTSRTYPTNQFSRGEYYGGSEMGLGYNNNRMIGGGSGGGYGNEMVRYGSGYSRY
jgi:hypothetical protein